MQKLYFFMGIEYRQTRLALSQSFTEGLGAAKLSIVVPGHKQVTVLFTIYCFECGMRTFWNDMSFVISFDVIKVRRITIN